MLYKAVVQNTHATTGKCAKCQFLVAGHAKLPDEKNIQISVQNLGNFESDRYTAAWQGKDYDINILNHRLEPLSKNLASVGSIAEQGLGVHLSPSKISEFYLSIGLPLHVVLSTFISKSAKLA